MENKDIASYEYIKEHSYAWYEHFKELFSTEGFFNWDIVSSVYITNPELYLRTVINPLFSNEKDLQKGLLKPEDPHENGSYHQYSNRNKRYRPFQTKSSLRHGKTLKSKEIK